MPGCANLEIYQGDDFGNFVEVFDSDDTPADLTGYTAQAQIRTDVADAGTGVVAEIVITIQLPNIITLYLPASITESMTDDCCYIWDLQLVHPSSAKNTVLTGNVYVTLEVTRAVA